MNFEWDPRKAEINYRRHGISFHEASSIFGDPLASTFLDPDHSDREQRFITVGVTNSGRLLMVAHADRGEIIRIISARKLTARERTQYEEKEE